MIFRVLVGFAAVTSAFELSGVSRRDFARAVAASPLAFAGAAFADANNDFLGKAAPGLGAGQVDKFGSVKKSIGRNAVIDEIGGAAVPETATRTAAGYAFASTRPGEKEKNAAQNKAMERLMAAKK